ncbi:hypothetical protein TNCV_4675611 [Trichonephila clavipes]|nr:hypothetical protein TNCV_4675611 [Trichonephila clavipes]
MLCPPRRHYFFEAILPPRLQTPQSDKPRQLSYNGTLLCLVWLTNIPTLKTRGQTMNNDPKAPCELGAAVAQWLRYPTMAGMS